MRRREFIAGIGSAIAWSPNARAQQPAMPVVGWLHSASPAPYAYTLEAFRRGIGEMGFAEGRNIAIEYRWAEDHFEHLTALAGELVERRVGLIFVGGGDVAALAAKAATATIPIVFAIGADPVRHGIVASMNRPGGNITGVSFLSVELRPKTLELVRDLLPGAAKIAVMVNPGRPDFERSLEEVAAPARAIGLEIDILKASNEHEIETAFAILAHQRVDALLVLSDPVFTEWRDQIARLALSYKVASIHASREAVVAGGLIGYGAKIEDAYRQAGNYAGQILKGTKPADLPVVQSSTFELVINLRTARFLGVTVPPTLIARADEVIE